MQEFVSHKQKYSKKQNHLNKSLKFLLPDQIINMIDQYMRFNCDQSMELSHPHNISCIATDFTNCSMKIYCCDDTNTNTKSGGILCYCINDLNEYILSEHMENETIHKMLVLDNGEIAIGRTTSLDIYDPVTKSYYSDHYGTQVIPLCEILDNQALVFAFQSRYIHSRGWLMLLHYKNKTDTFYRIKDVYTKIGGWFLNLNMFGSYVSFMIDLPSDFIKNTFLELHGSKFIALSEKQLYICDSVTDPRICVKYINWLNENKNICGFVTCDHMLIYFNRQGDKLLFADLLKKKNLNHIPIKGCNIYQIIKLSDKEIGFLASDLNKKYYVVFIMDLMTRGIKKIYQNDSQMQFVGSIYHDDDNKNLIVQEINEPFRILVIDAYNQSLGHIIETNGNKKPIVTISKNKLICVFDKKIVIFE